MKYLLIPLLLLAGCNDTYNINREHPDEPPPVVGCDVVEGPNRFDAPTFVRSMTEIYPLEEFCGRKSEKLEEDYLEFFAQDPLLFNFFADPAPLTVLQLELWVWDAETESYVWYESFVSGNDGELFIIQWPIPQGFFMLTHKNLLPTTGGYKFEFWSDV